MYVDIFFDCLFFLMNFFNSDFIFFFEDGFGLFLFNLLFVLFFMGDDNIDFG